MLRLLMVLFLLARPKAAAGDQVCWDETKIPPMIVPCSTAPTTTSTTILVVYTPPPVGTPILPPPIEGHPYAPPKAVEPASATARATRSTNG